MNKQETAAIDSAISSLKGALEASNAMTIALNSTARALMSIGTVVQDVPAKPVKAAKKPAKAKAEAPAKLTPTSIAAIVKLAKAMAPNKKGTEVKVTAVTKKSFAINRMLPSKVYKAFLSMGGTVSAYDKSKGGYIWAL